MAFIDAKNRRYLSKLQLLCQITIPIGSMYGIYANIWGRLMVNVTIIIWQHHGSYGIGQVLSENHDSPLLSIINHYYHCNCHFKSHTKILRFLVISHPFLMAFPMAFPDRHLVPLWRSSHRRQRLGQGGLLDAFRGDVWMVRVVMIIMVHNSSSWFIMDNG